jgi:hypothetical protein
VLVGYVTQKRLVQPSRPEECGIDEVRSTRSGQNIDAVKALRAVHLSEKLIHNPVGNAGRVVASLWGDRVKLVKEKDARFGCLGPFEQVPNLDIQKVSYTRRLFKESNNETKIRTDFSLAPMYLFRSSGPLMLMKLRPHSLATAEAKSVLPHPGYP